ncbi:ABC transporter ATP-binding protein [Catalinimonas sp. 4WD22]|uniref:ABC transporter ATP-binding protein n=1 Tax=Catalinimonas locisalis TaxID=3133978 RepID=UPI003101A391
MSAILSTENLTFSYGKQTKIHGLALNIPEGSCFGLLGQNGAGKSTVIKLLLGLLKAQQGNVLLFGETLTKENTNIFKKVGALIEDPPLYPYLTAEVNLRISALYHNVSANCVMPTLDKVGLASNAKQKVSTLSTGMKQRLGIALAILHDPQLLILDEPVNGLDPEGIVMVRKLIQKLHREEGKTIMLSSHLLNEVELSCDHVGILHQGKLLYQGSLDALHQEKYVRQQILVETDEPEKAYNIIQASFETVVNNGMLNVHIQSKADIPKLIDTLRRQEINIFQVKVKEMRLEDLYLHFTQAENTIHEKV